MSTLLARSEKDLWEYVDDVRPEIERALVRHLPLAPAGVGARFNDALNYALFPGGKRLRPLMTLLGAELLGARRADVMNAAVAVEFIHTCSLIFDDLPCMDDAAERRGRAALHRRYGESLSVLAALALLNTSYSLVFEGASDGGEKSGRAIRAHGELVECIGTNGMVTGQTVDLSGHGTGREGFDAVRNLKTSALIRLALRLGAILSGASARQLSALSRFSNLLGQAYQISDDVLDLSEDAALAAVDSRVRTLAFERGAKDARLKVASMVSQSKDALVSEFGRTRPARLLCEMADYIAAREA
jgi:geranylgeranyl diphosphate synthase type II